MKFECPHCSQHLACESQLAGRSIRCPRCKRELVIPQGHGDDESDKRVSELKDRIERQVATEQMTITEFMTRHQLEGGVDLESAADAASGIVTADQERKYQLGAVVAQGGMGAIVDARDMNIRRSVAMKVMLDPEHAGKDEVLRFIEEAQITGQLEHPAIVPVYELGVDSSSNVFYTMKFVKGRTLQSVLDSIKDGDDETVAAYPLGRLLTVFQKVCDALAFAHSKQIIHRDLKPENIMVGDFGEAIVLDWGLAKLLAEGRVADSGDTGIESLRHSGHADSLKTMDGYVIGTPQFMSPEQAAGEPLDVRSDVYALGAILYNILTLHAPFNDRDIDRLLGKVTKGDFPHPSSFNRKAEMERRRRR